MHLKKNKEGTKEISILAPPSALPISHYEIDESVLFIVQYKYLKLFSGNFYSPESDPLHKIMRNWFYYSVFIPKLYLRYG